MFKFFPRNIGYFVLGLYVLKLMHRLFIIINRVSILSSSKLMGEEVNEQINKSKIE